MLAEPISHSTTCSCVPVLLGCMVQDTRILRVLCVILLALLLTGRVLFAKDTRQASDTAPAVEKRFSSGSDSQSDVVPLQIPPECVDEGRGRDREGCVVPQRDKAPSESGQGLRPHGKVSSTLKTISAVFDIA